MLPDILLWIFAFLFYFVGDSVTTLIGIRVYGLQERNRIPKWVFDRFGLWTIAPQKLFFLVAVWWGWDWLTPKYPLLSDLFLLTFGIIGLFATSNNLFLIYRISQRSA